MWLALLAFFYSLPPVAALLTGLRLLARGDRRGLLAVLLPLTGRHWLRLLRIAAPDDPRPLIPDRRGIALGPGGVRLEWEQFGPDDAPALLLSHGWSLTHDTWYYQKIALSDEYRVIVWDMRGTGRSSAPANRDYSWEALVADLAAVFDATDAGRHPAGCVLAGHSLGAMLLPLFARQYPDRMRRVRGLALLAGTDRPLLESMRGREWLVPLRRLLWQPLARLMAACPLPFGLYDWLTWQTGAVHFALMFGRHNDRGTRGQNDLVARRCAEFSMRAAALGGLSCLDYHVRAALSEIAVPVLLLTGDRDPNMPPETQRAMAALLPDAELVLLPGCGHLNLLECHAEVNARLHAFARRCLAPSPPILGEPEGT
ncbi:MAG: alpha/beta hydrolase [Armatimonadetes bacterium]|nr:alpha/beta hydrolase [Armatimonadota bacterium]